MTTNKIRVLIVDDHPMIHIGLGGMLDVQDDIQVAGRATSGEEALLRCMEKSPDVVLMDLLLPGMSGTECISKIKRQFPEIQMIALSSYEDIEIVKAALEAGAVGYLLKNVPSTTLVAAIRDAHSGKRNLSPEIARALITGSQKPSMPHDDLTERELEVLAFIARGLSNGQIAEQLVVSPFTIKAHVSNILGKLGISSRAEAAAYAVQHKIVKRNN